MLKKAVCISGADAVAVFYDAEKFKRKGATPKRVQNTLFGQKGVQTLDNAMHKQRKEMFMSLMSPENLKKFSAITENYWKNIFFSMGKTKANCPF